MIINTTNLQEIRNQIQKLKKLSSTEAVIVKSQDEEFNRKVLEMRGVDILLSPELHQARDKLKQRDSGLNEFLCRLAAKNSIKIAINLEQLNNLEKKEKAKALARIMQNIQLCKRAKTQIILWPEKKYSKLDAVSFFKSLKGSTEQANL